ncbi:MAG TPA: phage holin family protein [Panacibacter sp.]|nr:phage holin family protein [Panacibacter sp.]HNP44988.1 phage holin family protein [Panacibacter sp.]
MDQQQNFFTESRKKIEEYVNDRILLLKLQSAEKISKIAAVMFTFLVLALLAFFILFFLSFMAGQYFGSLMGSLYAGYGVVTLFYVLLFVVIIGVRKKYIEKKIIDLMISIFFEKSNDENETEADDTAE